MTTPTSYISESYLAAPTELLNKLLPLLQPRQAELHYHAAVLEVSDAALLVELAANSKIRRHLLARLSDTVALIDPDQVQALAKSLLAEGHTPKMMKGIDP
jgi:hypothetical protein